MRGGRYTEFDEGHGRFSHNGKWVAYKSNESEPDEIYMQPFSPQEPEPATGGKWQVLTGGGRDPRWRGDGKELFYLAPDRKLMAVEVKTGSDLEAGIPRRLFQTRLFPRVLPEGNTSSPSGHPEDPLRCAVSPPGG